MIECRIRRVGDMFSGAGGFTEGAKRAFRARRVEGEFFAINHNEIAIATHKKNHPDAQHFPANVYRLSPRQAVPTGKLDILLASPTCIYNSRARGGQPISYDQRYGRMTPTQVYRWCKELEVDQLLVENVPEFERWGPICKNEGFCKVHEKEVPEGKLCGRPRKEVAGVYFRQWIARLKRLGFRPEWRVLKAANYGDPTTRERLFVMGNRDGSKPIWPEPTHSETGAGGLRWWRAAREVIRWELRGNSIFDRKKPLAKNTLVRIYKGVVRFSWPAPFVRKLRRYMESLGIEIPATVGGDGEGQLALPFSVVLRNHADARSLDRPLPTLCASGNHVGLVEPLLVRTAMHKSNALCVRTAGAPLATVTTDGGFAVVEPFILSQASGGAPRAVARPVPTIPTEGAHSLIVPVTHADSSNRARSVDQPLPTVTAAHRGELAFVSATFGERRGQAARVRSVEQPLPTVCAQGYVPLVHGVEDEDDVDILLRMLEPDELAGATGFEEGYEFPENKTDATMLIGNAVPVNMAAALVDALLEAS